MKKLTVAASALMLTGAMVSTAAAEITFSGDARARYYFQSDYDFGLSGNDWEEDHWNTRVRLKVKGTTASGAYAYLQLKGQTDQWGDDTDVDEIKMDYAYVNVPVGCVELRAGRQPWNLFTGFWNDVDVDAATVTWANDATTVVGGYAVLDSEYSDAMNQQREDRLWTAAVIQQFDNGWKAYAGMTVVNLDDNGAADPFYNDDNSGIVATIGGAGVIGPVAVSGEFGYQEDGFTATDEGAWGAGVTEQTDDDGYGFFVTAGMDFDAVNVTFVGGMTQDGFVFDAPVGFIMIGGDNQITPSQTAVIGEFAGAAMDTWFAGFKTSYQATETLGLGLNLAYADMEGADGGYADGDDADALEISADFNYAMADGVALKGRMGYLDLDVDDVSGEDAAFGAGLSLELKF